MERVIVTVQRYNDSQVRDIEIPVDISAETLLREISLTLGWNDACELYAEPPGRVLSPSETLLQAGVWDGARLTFRPLGTTGFRPGGSSPSAPPDRPPDQGPVKGWRPLDASGPSAPSSSQPPQPTPSGGFVWKRVDED